MADEDIPESLSARAAEWRTRTFDKHILLFLNDAESVAQVRCLPPNSTNAFTVITSRIHLSMPVLSGACFRPVGPGRRAADLSKRGGDTHDHTHCDGNARTGE